jgi:integrase
LPKDFVGVAGEKSTLPSWKAVKAALQSLDRAGLEFPLENHITPLIDEYVHEFRPALLRGRDEDVLFPGLRAGAKGKITFGTQLTDRILKHTGLRITAHQFRHAAAALILEKHPGNYELVRLILGHRNVQTTIKCYIGLKEVQATRIYGNLIRDRLNINMEAPE